MAKHPITRGYPNIEKSVYPHITDLNLRSSRDRFHWSLMLADYEGKWGFNTEVFRNDWCSKILPKLLEFEKLTWGQVTSQHKGRGSGTKHHHVPVSDLTRSAQKRLKRDLPYEDVDELFSLRLTGKIRVYGIVIEQELNLLWYDPNHEIFPIRR